jgi:broad specificity phosphatase PhoE
MRLNRRQGLVALSLLGVVPLRAAPEDEALRTPDGLVLLMRHALAPGGGDPPGLRLDDCSTQRNLSDDGRAQARRIGETLRARQLPVGALALAVVPHPRDRRAAGPGRAAAEPLFNSFFEDPQREQGFTDAARRRLAAWRGPGALLVVTHQVNITALSGVFPASGEIVLMRFEPAPRVLGRLQL